MYAFLYFLKENEMKKINELPYAQWLEDALRDLVDMPVESICIMTKFKDGSIANTYYNCNISDKITFAGYVQQDAMIDTMRINGYLVEGDVEEVEGTDG